MKDCSQKMVKAAAQPHSVPHPYGKHTKGVHHGGHAASGRGTPPAPMNQGPNQPKARKPITFHQGSKSPSQYGNAY